jgi:hypothetical protein
LPGVFKESFLLLSSLIKLFVGLYREHSINPPFLYAQSQENEVQATYQKELLVAGLYMVLVLSLCDIIKDF